MRVNVKKHVYVCLVWSVNLVNVWLVLKYWIFLNYLINLVSRNNAFPTLPVNGQNISTREIEQILLKNMQ